MTFLPQSQEQQRRRALPILVAARQEIIDGVLPLRAIAEAGEAGIECEFARRILRKVLFEANLMTWQSSHSTRQSDRTRAIDRAIRFARGAFGHRGGWAVSP